MQGNACTVDSNGFIVADEPLKKPKFSFNRDLPCHLLFKRIDECRPIWKRNTMISPRELLALKEQESEEKKKKKQVGAKIIQGLMKAHQGTKEYDLDNTRPGSALTK